MSGCYICGNKQISHGHHIWPQAYGGEEGPTVNLCGNCHGGLHQVALQSISKNPNKNALKPFTDEQMLRAEPLIRFIVMATLKSRSNPDMGQAVTLTVKPTRRTMQMLHMLKMNSSFTNMNDFILAILQSYIRSKL